MLVFRQQVRTIVKKGWFSDIEILEIHQESNTQDNNTVPDASSVVKHKQPNRSEVPTSENKNTTLPNNAQPSKPEETLSQEQLKNLENEKRIMNSNKTT